MAKKKEDSKKSTQEVEKNMEDSKKESVDVSKTPKSKKKSVKFMILNGIMNYSLLIALIIGLLAIVTGVFRELSLPVLILSVLLSLIHVIFTKKSNKKDFYLLISIASMLIVLGSLVSYLPFILDYLAISNNHLGQIGEYVRQFMVLISTITIIPAVKAAFNLVFLSSKE